MPLQYLRNVDFTLQSGYQFTSPYLAADEDNVYILCQRGSATRNAILAYTQTGTHLPGLSFNLPDGTFTGLELVNDTFFIVDNDYEVTGVYPNQLFFYRVDAFSAAGASRHGFDLAKSEVGTVTAAGQNFKHAHASPSGIAYLPDLDLFMVGGGRFTSNSYFADIWVFFQYALDGQLRDFNVTSISLLQYLRSMAASDTYLYVSGTPYHIRAFSHLGEPVAAEDITSYGSVYGNLVSSAIAWNGTELVLLTSSGSNGRLTFYGHAAAETPTVTLPESVVQFRGFHGWTERFDILRPLSGARVHIVALNIEAIQQTSTQFANVSAEVGVTDQLSHVTLTPRRTLPAVEIGDIIVPAQGLSAAQVKVIPSEDRFVVEGISSVGTRSQQIVASRSLV